MVDNQNNFVSFKEPRVIVDGDVESNCQSANNLQSVENLPLVDNDKDEEEQDENEVVEDEDEDNVMHEDANLWYDPFFA